MVTVQMSWRSPHLLQVVVERVQEKEQQLLGVLLGVVVELGEDGAQHRPGLHRGTAGAPAQPHLFQQAHKHLGHLALGPARAEIKPVGKTWLSTFNQ